MIYVDTLMDVLLRYSSIKSGDITHDKTEISLFSIITLDAQSQWQRMSNLWLDLNWGRQKQIYSGWAIFCLTLIAFVNLAGRLKPALSIWIFY